MPNNHISRIQVIKKEVLTFKTKKTVHFYHSRINFVIVSQLLLARI